MEGGRSCIEERLGGEEGMVLEGEAYKLMGLHPVVQSSLTLPQLKLSITSSLANCIQ